MLCYHDLREDDDPENWLRVSRTNFREHLNWLTRHGVFVSPLTGESVRSDSELPFRFLLTFDDGYRNNLEIALPLMEAFEVPGLFFISTWHAVSQTPFWFDRVFAAIYSGNLWELDLTEQGLRKFRFRAGAPSARWDDIQSLLTAIKFVGNEDHPVVRMILDRCDDFHDASGIDLLNRYRPLSLEEMGRMAESKFCHFGSHAHHHRILNELEPEEIAASLLESRNILERATCQSIVHIAYPNGDYGPEVVEQCRRLGFKYGFTTRRGIGQLVPGQYEIPRILIGGFDDTAKLRYKVMRCVL